MNKEETNTSLKKKYHNEEHVQHAKQQPEKRVAADPFLKGNGLQQGVSGKQKKVVLRSAITIVAFTLMVFTVKGLWLFSHHPSKTAQTVQVTRSIIRSSAYRYVQTIPENKSVQTPLKPIPHQLKKIKRSPAKPNTKINPESTVPVPEPMADASIITKKTDTVNKDTTPFNEMVVTEMTSPDKKTKTTAANNAAIKQGSDREINTGNRDSLKTIALKFVSGSSNKTAVYNPQKREVYNGVVADAHPQHGWSNFKKYLNENAASPDGKAGMVKLSFMIDPSGTITGIKVVKRLSTATDQKAIDLIVDGPGWRGSKKGHTEKINMQVKFAR